ncbi:LIM/homeobox protein Lhx9-like isoform X3 [Octopus sinensis]|nr:LIM/homeobox protein Lhx9-like isoform X3 [Octopus sinensis]XP_036357673.1 LIM/homeobox protein Lhx9-like isoform X3 [Octopus sinensis]XP_036357679.1 LIM/homeobox protein Lhx9-like isoform X3 [Octopus sinensis]XP_036357684.1 LIM/homeobox protein Lhx9-like isoform X3 [Octopus sinensis]
MVLGGNFLLLDCLKVTFKDQFRMSDSPKDLRADSLESPSRMWLCASCGKRIMDRYYMMVAERQWHASCLKCCECKLRLDSYLTCFARNGNLYCKEDYYRRYAIRQCARCNTGISAQELVMRVRDLVYHLGCFVCEGCNRPLTKGDHFGMKGDLVYCRTDYELLFQEGCREYVPLREQRTDESGGHNESLCDVRPLVAGLERGHVPSNYTGVVLPIQPKGRSRKRKTGCLNATLNCQAGGMTTAEGLDRSTNDLERDAYSTPRQKRMRTSFKHHQLRTLKSYFALNHNPDTKDLKQLAQKTGLNKRVLQVWFQNARAKYRRNILKQEEKQIPPPQQQQQQQQLQRHQAAVMEQICDTQSRASVELGVGGGIHCNKSPALSDLSSTPSLSDLHHQGTSSLSDPDASGGSSLAELFTNTIPPITC